MRIFGNVPAVALLLSASTWSQTVAAPLPALPGPASLDQAPPPSQEERARMEELVRGLEQLNEEALRLAKPHEKEAVRRSVAERALSSKDHALSALGTWAYENSLDRMRRAALAVDKAMSTTD